LSRLSHWQLIRIVRRSSSWISCESSGPLLRRWWVH